MDIPTPDELVAQREQEQREAVMHYLGRCLKTLREQFDGSNEVAISTHGASDVTIAAATEALRAAGWVCRLEAEWSGPRRGKGKKGKALLIGRREVV